MNKPLTFLTAAVAGGLAITGVTHLWAENASPSPSPAAAQHGKGPHRDMRGGPGDRGGWACHREGRFGRFDRGRGGPGGEMGHGQMMGRMLNLTDDQKAKVKAIMEANKPKIEAIRKEEQAKIQAVMEDAKKQIAPILTPEQQKVMDDAQQLRQNAQQLRQDAQKLRADKAATDTTPAQ